MKQILHIITGLAMGGAEMALYRLIQASRGGDYAHTVIALTPGEGLYARFVASGIRLIVLDLRRSPVTQTVALCRLVRRLQPDIVQTWLYHADFFGGLAARLAGNRNVIWGVRTTDVNGGCARSTAVVRYLCAWLSRWVPHTIVCVADAARRSHCRIGYDPARMVVMGNGFEIGAAASAGDARSRLRQQCGFADGDVVVGTVGRFNPDKDHANFVRAAGLLAARDARVRFLMVGTDLDPRNAALMRWIGDTGHAGRFVLLGERADVPACLAAMDVFCLSSMTEAFPNAVGEAMAMGLPCVATDVGDVAALMADTGVVVPKADAPALAAAVAGLLALDAAARARMGERARERIRTTYTMASVRRRFELLYDNVMTKGRR